MAIVPEDQHVEVLGTCFGLVTGHRFESVIELQVVAASALSVVVGIEPELEAEEGIAVDVWVGLVTELLMVMPLGP